MSASATQGGHNNSAYVRKKWYFNRFTNNSVSSLVVMALDLRLDGRKFESRLPRLIGVLGWVTVFGRAVHLTISPSYPGQLSLLPSRGWEMSTAKVR